MVEKSGKGEFWVLLSQVVPLISLLRPSTIPKGTPSAESLNKHRFTNKRLQFSAKTNRPISQYLGNGTRQAYIQRTLTESHGYRYSIDPCQLRWPWVTLKGETRAEEPSFSWPISIKYTLTPLDSGKDRHGNTHARFRGSSTPLHPAHMHPEFCQRQLTVVFFC